MRRLVLILTLTILLTSVLAQAEDETSRSRGFTFMGQYYDLSDCVKTLLVVGGIALFSAAEDAYYGDPLLEHPDAILFVPDDAIPTANKECDRYASWSRPESRSRDEDLPKKALVQPTVSVRPVTRTNCEFERRGYYDSYGTSGTYYRSQSRYSERSHNSSSYSYSTEEHYTYPSR